MSRVLSLKKIVVLQCYFNYNHNKFHNEEWLMNGNEIPLDIKSYIIQNSNIFYGAVRDPNVSICFIYNCLTLYEAKIYDLNTLLLINDLFNNKKNNEYSKIKACRKIINNTINNKLLMLKNTFRLKLGGFNININVDKLNPSKFDHSSGNIFDNLRSLYTYILSNHSYAEINPQNIIQSMNANKDKAVGNYVNIFKLLMEFNLFTTLLYLGDNTYLQIKQTMRHYLVDSGIENGKITEFNLIIIGLFFTLLASGNISLFLTAIKDIIPYMAHNKQILKDVLFAGSRQHINYKIINENHVFTLLLSIDDLEQIFNMMNIYSLGFLRIIDTVNNTIFNRFIFKIKIWYTNEFNITRNATSKSNQINTFANFIHNYIPSNNIMNEYKLDFEPIDNFYQNLNRKYELNINAHDLFKFYNDF
jgi:hypothetical protein